MSECNECNGNGVVAVVNTLSTGEQELVEAECMCVVDDFLAAHAIDDWSEEE